MKIAYVAMGIAALAVGVVGYATYAARSVEQAAYRVVHADGDFEIRDYPSLIVAETQQAGDRQSAVRSGFQALARYIFARDRDGDAIAMTAPVLQARGPDPSDWRVRFVMPAQTTIADLPRPASSGVALVETAPQRMAAVRFSGWWSDALFAEREAALRRWLADSGRRPASEAVFAYYNDPFTPGFLRRNEVLIAIAPQPL